MNQIHICHIVESAGGGVETYILNLLRHCSRRTFQHTVVCWKNGTLGITAKQAGAEVIMLPMVREISPLRDSLSLLRVISVLWKIQARRHSCALREGRTFWLRGRSPAEKARLSDTARVCLLKWAWV